MIVNFYLIMPTVYSTCLALRQPKSFALNGINISKNMLIAKSTAMTVEPDEKFISDSLLKTIND